jgi:peroxiredoxin
MDLSTHHVPRRAFLATLAAPLGLALGGCVGRDPAPGFAYTLLDGTQAHTSQLRGKVVLVNFWSTRCATCIQAMPQMAQTQRSFQARGFETLAVALRIDPPAAVAAFAQRHRLPFGVVIDNTGAIADAFGDLRATPTSYLIDKRGALVRRIVGEPDFTALHAQVEQLLAEA